MKNFFENKNNIILCALCGVSVVSVVLASFVTFFVPISCIVCGLLCCFIAYLLFLRYVNKRRNRTSDFMQEDSKLKQKTRTFIEAESRTDTLILAGIFVVGGVFLIILAINMF